MKNKVCPNCGCDYEFLFKHSKLGCGLCYVIFEKEISLVTISLQNYAKKHFGKKPQSSCDPVSAFVIRCIDESEHSEDDKKNLKMFTSLNNISNMN